MKKLPAIILLLLITVSTLMQSCGESDCPLTTKSFAHFDFLDAETHQAVKFSPAFDVTGFITCLLYTSIAVHFTVYFDVLYDITTISF